MQAKTKNKVVFGYIIVITWCLVSAFARLYVSDSEQHFDPYFVSLFIFSFATLVFFLLSVHRLPTVFKKSREALFDVVGLNVSTCISWFFLLYPLKYIEPSLVSTISLGLAPVSVFILGLFFYRQ